MRRWVFAAVLLLGCSDQNLRGLGEGEYIPDDDDAAQVLCADIDRDWTWLASPAFAEEPDPDDGALPFWDVAFDDAAWSTVALPDTTGIPVGFDRAYRAIFDLDDVPADGLALDLQSDDGLAVWVNGELLGRWGGGWQQEGCVGSVAGCIDTIIVDPVAIESMLVPGPNLVAARVSNPIMDAYFDLIPTCDP
jgi:hypothetical protein